MLKIMTPRPKGAAAPWIRHCRSMSDRQCSNYYKNNRGLERWRALASIKNCGAPKCRDVYAMVKWRQPASIFGRGDFLDYGDFVIYCIVFSDCAYTILHILFET